jgi:hypothetical protein
MPHLIHIVSLASFRLCSSVFHPGSFNISLTVRLSFVRSPIYKIDVVFSLLRNLVPRACDPREGTCSSGIIRFREESDWPLKWNAQFNLSQDSWLPETDYPRASRSFSRIAGSGNEIDCCEKFNYNLVPRVSPSVIFPKERSWVRGGFNYRTSGRNRSCGRIPP